VRAEGHHAVPHALEGAKFLPGQRIPYFHHVSRRAGQAFAVRAVGHATASSLEGKKFLAGLGIPDLHREVVLATGQAFAVRTERDAFDPAGVPLEGEDLLASLRIPHLYLSFRTTRSASQAIAIGAEGHAGDTGVVPLAGKDLLAGLRIPHFQ